MLCVLGETGLTIELMTSRSQLRQSRQDCVIKTKYVIELDGTISSVRLGQSKITYGWCRDGHGDSSGNAEGKDNDGVHSSGSLEIETS